MHLSNVPGLDLTIRQSKYMLGGVYGVPLKRNEMHFTDIPRRDPEHKVILALQEPLEDGPSMLCGKVTFVMVLLCYASECGGL